MIATNNSANCPALMRVRRRSPSEAALAAGNHEHRRERDEREPQGGEQQRRERAERHVDQDEIDARHKGHGDREEDMAGRMPSTLTPLLGKYD